jgi:hypothetical protein
MRTHDLAFNGISGFHLIAEFKAEITAALIKNEGQLTTNALIKAEVTQLKLILKRKRKVL